MSRRGFRRQVRQQLEAEWRTAFQIAGARKLNIWMSETKLGAEVAFRSLLIPGWWIEVRYAKRHRIFGRIEPFRSTVDASNDLRAELASYVEAGTPPSRWAMPRTPLPLVGAGLGVLTGLVGGIAQPFVPLTYLSVLDTTLADRLISLSMLLALLAFPAIWLIAAKRSDFAGGWNGFFAGVPGILPRLVRFLGIYSLLAFLLLVLVSIALDSKGVEAVSGHFYIRHSFPELPTEISKAEYQHQVAYLFWWISTLALVWGTLLFSMALRAFVRPWRAEGEPTQLSNLPVS